MVFTTSMLREKYDNYANPLDKIKRDTDRGILIRLARGLYEVNGGVNPCFLASSILYLILILILYITPSY